MNQLIPTFTGKLAGEQQTLVNARDLHSVLGVGKDFTNWIKDRIATYGFTEGEEFSPKLAKTSFFGGRPKTEYQITLEMAKELCLVENTAQGKKARRYFIEMEKVARQEIPAFLRREPAAKAQLAQLQAIALAAKPLWAHILRYRALKLTQREISKLVGVKEATVRHHLKQMAACGIGDYRVNVKLAAAGRKGLQIAQQRALQVQGGAA